MTYDGYEEFWLQSEAILYNVRLFSSTSLYEAYYRVGKCVGNFMMGFNICKYCRQNWGHVDVPGMVLSFYVPMI